MKTTIQISKAKYKFRSSCFMSTSLLVLLITTGSRPSFAQTSQVPPKLAATLAERQAEQDWTQADWVLDNTGYASIRSQIDKSILRGEKVSSLELKYRMKGKEIYDPLKIFRWAYAAYRLQKSSPNANFIFDINAALNRNLKPGAYDWVRLRYLVASLQPFGAQAYLIPIGKRLLNRKPKDREVLYQYLRQLQGSESAKDRQDALVWAKAEAKKVPTDPLWQWLVANATMTLARYSNSYADNEKALAEYKKTLQLLPSNSSDRQRVIDTIVYLDLKFDEHGQPRLFNKKMLKEAIKNTTLR